MDYPEIEVKDLSVGEVLELLDGGGGMVGLLINASIQNHDKQYLLSWNGNKVPRGARVDGHIIAWTQHGIITNSNGTTIGHYQRLSEFGGHDGTEQRMLVAMLRKGEEALAKFQRGVCAHS